MKPLFLPFLLAVVVTTGRAALYDEIQVYTDDINPPGKFGLELHVNTTPSGRATPEYPGEVTPLHGLRVTPEFSYGLTHELEAGLYLPLHYSAANGADLAGGKLRLKWLPLQPGEHHGAFAGLNVEVGWLQREFDAAHWGSELRTIFGYRTEEWLLATNPVFEWALAGPERTARPDLEMQFKAARKILPGLAIGPEYYAGFGPLGRPSPRAEQEHSLYLAFDVDRGPVAFNAGIGRGFRAADRWTMKFIFEIPW
jgi:hypothetical protein